MRVKSILIWLNEFQFGENKLANFGSKFFNLAKILAKESKTLARALSYQLILYMKLILC